MRETRTIIIAATAAMLAACGAKTNTPTPNPAPETVAETPPQPLTVTVLDCGTIDVSDLDIFSSAGDYAGMLDTFTNTCWLVRHPEGTLLWDLGLPSMLANSDPQENPPFTVSLDQTLTDQLLDMGLSANEVDTVAISHSHFDHIGQIDQFLNATWLVHRDEYETMFPPAVDGEPEEAPSDMEALFAPYASLERETFVGEQDVFGDGSVVIFETPGHTPGHTSLQVTLPEMGPILLTGDLYHRSESRDLKRVPRFNFAEPATLESIDLFEARAERIGARVIIQHEPADIQALPPVLR